MKNNEELIRIFYHDLWNKFDKSLIEKILVPDFEFRGSLGQTKTGHKGFVEYVDYIKNFSYNFHNEILEIISEGNKAFVKLKFSGNHTGEAFGIKPTNKDFYYHGAAIFEFKEGLIKKLWVLGDIYNLLKQLKS